MTTAFALFAFTALVIAPVTAGVTLARRFGDRVTAFHWIVLACCYVGLVLSMPALEDAAAGRRPWSDALLVAAAMTLMPVLYVLAVSLKALPFLLIEALASRRRDDGTPPGPPPTA